MLSVALQCLPFQVTWFSCKDSVILSMFRGQDTDKWIKRNFLKQDGEVGEAVWYGSLRQEFYGSLSSENDFTSNVFLHHNSFQGPAKNDRQKCSFVPEEFLWCCNVWSGYKQTKVGLLTGNLCILSVLPWHFRQCSMCNNINEMSLYFITLA